MGGSELGPPNSTIPISHWPRWYRTALSLTKKIPTKPISHWPRWCRTFLSMANKVISLSLSLAKKSFSLLINTIIFVNALIFQRQKITQRFLTRFLLCCRHGNLLEFSHQITRRPIGRRNANKVINNYFCNFPPYAVGIREHAEFSGQSVPDDRCEDDELWRASGMRGSSANQAPF